MSITTSAVSRIQPICLRLDDAVLTGRSGERMGPPTRRSALQGFAVAIETAGAL
jgi:hypothetical protein